MTGLKEAAGDIYGAGDGDGVGVRFGGMMVLVVLEYVEGRGRGLEVGPRVTPRALGC